MSTDRAGPQTAVTARKEALASLRKDQIREPHVKG